MTARPARWHGRRTPASPATSRSTRRAPRRRSRWATGTGATATPSPRAMSSSFNLIKANKADWASYNAGRRPTTGPRSDRRRRPPLHDHLRQGLQPAVDAGQRAQPDHSAAAACLGQDQHRGAVGDVDSTPAGAVKVWDVPQQGGEEHLRLRHEPAVEDRQRPLRASSRSPRRARSSLQPPTRSTTAATSPTSRPSTCCRSPRPTPRRTPCAAGRSTTATSAPTDLDQKKSFDRPRATRSSRGPAGRSPTCRTTSTTPPWVRCSSSSTPVRRSSSRSTRPASSRSIFNGTAVPGYGPIPQATDVRLRLAGAEGQPVPVLDRRRPSRCSPTTAGREQDGIMVCTRRRAARRHQCGAGVAKGTKFADAGAVAVRLDR